jgi:dTDP-4-dehydrorhamnose reductase
VRIWLTGARGFVGSHVRAVFEARGAQVAAPTREEVDVTDARAVRESIEAFAPDALVHCAILNDLTDLAANRRAAWEGYVGATRNVVAAAGDAHVVLISTDWVFDGTQAGATEDEPPNPINPYGFLKAASELVVSERARKGSVARISGVQGAASGPRQQDHGFGYFVASLVGALRAGKPFTVWEADTINMRATPTLASDVGELLWRMLERERTGIHHCCGGESVTRAELARATVRAFDLDPSLLRFGPPPPPASPVPYDTSIDGTRTADALGVELPGVADQLARLQDQLT